MANVELISALDDGSPDREIAETRKLIELAAQRSAELRMAVERAKAGNHFGPAPHAPRVWVQDHPGNGDVSHEVWAPRLASPVPPTLRQQPRHCGGDLSVPLPAARFGAARLGPVPAFAHSTSGNTAAVLRRPSPSLPSTATPGASITTTSGNTAAVLRRPSPSLPSTATPGASITTTPLSSASGTYRTTAAAAGLVSPPFAYRPCVTRSVSANPAVYARSSSPPVVCSTSCASQVSHPATASVPNVLMSPAQVYRGVSAACAGRSPSPLPAAAYPGTASIGNSLTVTAVPVSGAAPATTPGLSASTYEAGKSMMGWNSQIQPRIDVMLSGSLCARAHVYLYQAPFTPSVRYVDEEEFIVLPAGWAVIRTKGGLLLWLEFLQDVHLSEAMIDIEGTVPPGPLATPPPGGKSPLRDRGRDARRSKSVTPPPPVARRLQLAVTLQLPAKDGGMRCQLITRARSSCKCDTLIRLPCEDVMVLHPNGSEGSGVRMSLVANPAEGGRSSPDIALKSWLSSWDTQL
eukprot:TRINITY_DN859_c0_g1_i3.p1 TRINITY_DN859_c0_g1~~TRINITY_DN859_c0_g1_i3.p1  ORF type:complete len:520 (-),score=49.04 TRINITY_DN859_c0_g1_i3:91-1650(-)